MHCIGKEDSVTLHTIDAEPLYDGVVVPRRRTIRRQGLGLRAPVFAIPVPLVLRSCDSGNGVQQSSFTDA